MGKIYLEGLDNLKQDIINGVAELLDAKSYKASVNDKSVLDLKQTAEKLGVQPETLRLKASKGLISHVRSNGNSGKYFFSQKHIDDYLNNTKGISKSERKIKFREGIEPEIAKQFKR